MDVQWLANGEKLQRAAATWSLGRDAGLSLAQSQCLSGILP